MGSSVASPPPIFSSDADLQPGRLRRRRRPTSTRRARSHQLTRGLRAPRHSRSVPYSSSAHEEAAPGGRRSRRRPKLALLSRARTWSACSPTSRPARPRGSKARLWRRADHGERRSTGQLRDARDLLGLHERNAIVREEIFGPVMSVLDLQGEDEVVAGPMPRVRAWRPECLPAISRAAIGSSPGCRPAPAGSTTTTSPQSRCRSAATSVGHRPRERQAAIEHYTQLKSVFVELGPVQCPYE